MTPAALAGAAGGMEFGATDLFRAVSGFAGVGTFVDNGRRSLGALQASSGVPGADFCPVSLEGGSISTCSRSRRTPRRKSLPSLRQFLAIAENCSLFHFTISLDPIEMGFLSRMQAPDGDVSSSVAGAR